MRLSWIDIVRGICMFCVVLSHTVQVPAFYRCIFEPFFLTTFFFLSGVVFKIHSVKKSLFNSVIRILWPYFINSIIVILGRMSWIKMLYDGNNIGVIEYFQHSWHRIITGRMFWFLVCLFIVQVLAIFVTYILKNKKPYISIVSIVCLFSIFLISGKEIALWNANTAILSLGYFLVGIICRDKLMSFNPEKIKKCWGVLAVAMYVTLIAVIYTISPNPVLFDLNTHKLSPEYLYLLLSIIGIIAVCLFAMSLRRCKVLQMIGENSLLVYMYHGYGLVVTRALFKLLHIDLLAQCSYVYSILFSCTATITTIVIAIIIDRYFPILIGRGLYIDKITNKLFSK